MNGTVFLAYVEQVLAPTLWLGDVVIIGNLPSHKASGMRDLIEGVGAELPYLPPYSTDFNTIENAFSKLKTLLRKNPTRTVDAICDAIGDLLKSFTPQECANYSKNAGYDPT